MVPNVFWGEHFADLGHKDQKPWERHKCDINKKIVVL